MLHSLKCAQFDGGTGRCSCIKMLYITVSYGMKLCENGMTARFFPALRGGRSK